MSSQGGRRALASLAAFSLACGVAPQATRDAGIVFVPRRYQQAASTGGHVAHVGAAMIDGGTVRCGSCHDIVNHGFQAPGLGRCRDCHPAQADFRHGGDGGVVSCTACHPFVARGAALPASPWECQECHQQPQGRTPAIERHGAGCFFCHQPHRQPFTLPTRCVICHAVGLVHGAEGEPDAQQCLGCHPRHRPAAEASRTCVACHSDGSKQKRAGHLVTQRALFKGHGSCGKCHQAHRFARNQVTPCESCHPRVLARQNNSRAHAKCAGCHDPHAADQPPRACASCHPKIVSTHPVKYYLDACQSCHPPHGRQGGGPSCESCHFKAELTGVVHATDAKGQPLACAKCHPSHSFAVKPGSTALCRECHAPIFSLAAMAKKEGHARCADCHPGLPHKPEKPAKPCLACHAALAQDKSGHTRCPDCHEAHSGKVAKSCLSCHPAKKLPGLHAGVRHERCADCHSAHDPQPGPPRALCLSSCHKAQRQTHQKDAASCTGCHLFRDAKSGPPTK